MTDTPARLVQGRHLLRGLRPRVFSDSNGDGNGDLRGLIEKLDYLRDLGVDCLWLMPIYRVAAQGRRLRHRRLLRHPSRRSAPSRTSRP